MTTSTAQKTLLTLPPEVLTAFENLTDLDERDSYVRALRVKGWTLQSIAQATGVTRERVRQIAVLANPNVDISALPLPEPPSKPTKPKPVYVEPSPATLARLLELKPLAMKVRSNSPDFRKEAEEYTALIWQAHKTDGVTLYRLAKRLGVTHGALRFRLARYGYLKPSGTSKVYSPIKPENRAK